MSTLINSRDRIAPVSEMAQNSGEMTKESPSGGAGGSWLLLPPATHTKHYFHFSFPFACVYLNIFPLPALRPAARVAHPACMHSLVLVFPLTFSSDYRVMNVSISFVCPTLHSFLPHKNVASSISVKLCCTSLAFQSAPRPFCLFPILLFHLLILILLSTPFTLSPAV